MYIYSDCQKVCGEFMEYPKGVKRVAALLLATFGMAVFAGNPAFAITPNKLVSGGLKAHAGSTTTDYLTDGYLTNWKSSSEKKLR